MTEERRDRTLDSFVTAWAAPPPGSQFHSRVRRAFDREFVKVPWWGRYWRQVNGTLAWRAGQSLCGGAAVGAFALVMTGLAFPQTGRFRLPWLQPSLTIDFEEIVYADDGTRTVDRYFRTVPMDGHDMVLWKYFPNHPYDHVIEGIENQAGYLLYRITLPLFKNTEQTNVIADPRAAYVKTGCIRGDKTIPGDESILGKEILLGYPTTVVQWTIQQRHMKATTWLAPTLGCRELRITSEGQRPDGTYRLFFERRALDVTP